MVGILEEESLWYQYKSKVWLQNSEQSKTVHNIMRTIRTIHNYSDLLYISVPITSGKFLYELKKAQSDKPIGVLLNTAIGYNYQKGLELLSDLKERSNSPILYPAELTPIHQEWEQEHFQALWLSIIAEKCTELHMSDGWEFSNGGTEELTHVFQLKLGVPNHKELIFFNTKEQEKEARERMRKISVYDSKGTTISIDDAISSVLKSLDWINKNGHSAPKIESCLVKLKNVRTLLQQNFYQ